MDARDTRPSDQSSPEESPSPEENPGEQPGRGPCRRKSESDSPTGFERRRGPGRRLSDFVRAAEEGELTKEQFLFLMAIEAFKKSNSVVYPSWTDVLEVVRLLGYRKTLPSATKLSAAEDWTEAPDAPVNVHSKAARTRKTAA